MALVGGSRHGKAETQVSPDVQSVEMGERVYAEFKRYRATVVQIKNDCEARLIAAERMFAGRVEAIVQMNTPLANGDAFTVPPDGEDPE